MSEKEIKHVKANLFQLMYVLELCSWEDHLDTMARMLNLLISNGTLKHVTPINWDDK